MCERLTNIEQIIFEGETLFQEFKSEKAHPNAISAVLVSFLNTEGGVLFLGIEDDGTVSGISEPDFARQRMDRITENNIFPKASVYIESIDFHEKWLLKVNVPRGLDRPYHTNQGQCFIRTNAGKRLASREEIRRMYLQIRSFYYDETSVSGTDLKDIDIRNFDDFLNLAYGFPIDESRTESERLRLLKNLKAMGENGLTVAGLLFFGIHPQEFIPTGRIDFARFAGLYAGETILDRKELTGRLPKQLEDMEVLFGIHLKRNGSIKNFGAEVRLEMPMEMLREIIVNALVHRDYSISSSVRVLMFDDRIEVHSPGGLPNGLNIENIRAGIHVERNPVILSLMAKLGLMTRLGTGILRVLRLASENGLQEPKLENLHGEFVATLYRLSGCVSYRE